MINWKTNVWEKSRYVSLHFTIAKAKKSVWKHVQRGWCYISVINSLLLMHVCKCHVKAIHFWVTLYALVCISTIKAYLTCKPCIHTLCMHKKSKHPCRNQLHNVFRQHEINRSSWMISRFLLDIFSSQSQQEDYFVCSICLFVSLLVWWSFYLSVCQLATLLKML